MSRLLLAALFLLAAGAPDTSAQEPPPPLSLQRTGDEARVRIRLNDVLADPSLQDALHSGLPLRLEITAQLWSDGFFDGEEGAWRWRASAVYDPLGRSYVLTLPDDGNTELRHPTLGGLRRALTRTFEPGLRPEDEGDYYYTARIEIETLSLSDLEELRRWLRGDLAEALAGEADVEGVVERGLRRTVVRLLGLPTRRYETRTPTFEHRDGAGNGRDSATPPEATRAVPTEEAPAGPPGRIRRRGISRRSASAR